MHEALKAGPTGITQPAALKGFGGIGKTELALAYTALRAGEFDAGYFIVASSLAALDNGLAKIADPLLPENADIEAVQACKAQAVAELQRTEKVLLILDNVDDVVQEGEFKKLIAALPKARILLTCRHGDMGDVRQVEVEKMDEGVGALYLLRASDKKNRNRWDEFSAAEQTAAQECSRELDGLPLALHHAAGTIKAEGLSVQEFLYDYRKDRARILKNRGQGPSHTHPESVWTMIDYALTKLRRKSPAAAELVTCCAFLAPDAISEDIFIKCWVEVGKPLADRMSEFPAVRAEAIASSLIGRVAEESRLTIHRVTQAVIQELVNEVEWERLYALEPHLIKALHGEGRHVEQLAHAEFGLVTTRRRLGYGDAACVGSMNNLALSYGDLGRYGEALEMQRDTFRLMRTGLGDGNPKTLICMDNLSIACLRNGLFEEALDLGGEALRLRREVLGEDHPDVLVSINNLAAIYIAKGDYAKALELADRAYELVCAMFGDCHRGSLVAACNLAVTYSKLGRHVTALGILERVLPMMQEVLGAGHPATLMARNNLACSYASLGRHEEALQLQIETLRLTSAALGEDHPDTLLCLRNLANSLSSIGRPEEALRNYEETLRLSRAKLGEDHPDTLSVMNDAAVCLSALGRHDEALAADRAVFVTRCRKLGQDHPSTLASLNNVAADCSALGRHEEARSLHEETLRLRRVRLGADHPDTLQSAYNLGEELRHVDRFREAAAIWRDSLELGEKAGHGALPVGDRLRNALRAVLMRHPELRKTGDDG